MFSFYLAAAETEMALGDKLLLGGQVSLLGMGTVFSVLAILWGLVELMHLLLTGVSGDKKKKKAEAPVEAPAAAPAPVVSAPRLQRQAARRRRPSAWFRSSAQTIVFHPANKF